MKSCIAKAPGSVVSGVIIGPEVLVAAKGRLESRRINPLLNSLFFCAVPTELRIADQVLSAYASSSTVSMVHEFSTGAIDGERQAALGVEIVGQMPTTEDGIHNAFSVRKRFAVAKRELVSHSEIEHLWNIVYSNGPVSILIVKILEN